ncbi:MAG: hypothetical protein KAU01_04820 [Candidatus Cloacimonetes bacterium]|nr:hypothetical protein [Candidatus Cloacimonadota bacterium]
MWLKLIELIIDRYFKSFTNKKKAAKSLVRLYISMKKCHDSYHEFKIFRDRKLQFIWKQTLISLATDLYDLRIPLEIFNPELYSAIFSYVQEESDLIPLFDGVVFDKDIIDLYKKLNAELSQYLSYDKSKYNLKTDESSFQSTDYQKALDLLRQFIKQNVLFEDLF